MLLNGCAIVYLWKLAVRAACVIDTFTEAVLSWLQDQTKHTRSFHLL